MLFNFLIREKPTLSIDEVQLGRPRVGSLVLHSVGPLMRCEW